MDSEIGRAKIRHFTDFEVWQKAHGLFLKLLADLEELPRTRAAEIVTDQLLRAAASISANIAEGFNRSTKKFLSSLDIALGETNETENWLYKLQDARLLDTATCATRIEQTKEIGRMLNSLIRSINAKHSND